MEGLSSAPPGVPINQMKRRQVGNGDYVGFRQKETRLDSSGDGGGTPRGLQWGVSSVHPWVGGGTAPWRPGFTQPGGLRLVLVWNPSCFSWKGCPGPPHSSAAGDRLQPSGAECLGSGAATMPRVHVRPVCLCVQDRGTLTTPRHLASVF